ncbi:glycosyltransferase family 9 protein [Armatimonas sp.]|uniref:glycosyltransferase family 9 protein n=1 Tax=Armatimonas sp. TaxID=1872638 RepID=UPI0037513037
MRIAVVTKHKYMGDTLIATPLLRGIKQAYPDSHVTLVAGAAAAQLLENCPYTDAIEVFRKGESIVPLAKKLMRPEICFLVDRSFRAGMLGVLCGAKQRVGFNVEGRSFLLTHRVPYLWDKREIVAYLDLLQAISPGTYDPTPILWVKDDEKAAARARLAPEGKRFIGMQPGANDPYVREWKAEHYALVGDRLSEQLGARVILFGTDTERNAAETVAAMMQHKPLMLVGQTKLREAMALISCCDLWIGNDGGLLHLAAGVGLPTVGIFGPTKYARWHYDGPRHRSLTSYVPPGMKVTDDAIRAGLDAITPDRVEQAARELISEFSPP